MFADDTEDHCMGSSYSERYPCHSIKSGYVQLCRSLGIRDEMVMQIVQMSRNHAYTNYFAAYNDCAPEEIPKFTSISELVRHADQICKEKSHEQL